jgi:predicted RND superfamily exporter protein
MLGTMHLLGMKLHYMNIIALPMIVGIGVDAGLHLLQRYYEDERRNLRAAVTRTGRAVVITSMTTMLGFGSLSLAHFQGLRELGLVAIIGVLYTMFGALLVLPAVLRMLDPRITYRGGPGDDLG